MATRYEYLTFITIDSHERKISLWKLRHLKYTIELNRNQKQFNYFLKIQDSISNFEKLMCDFTLVFTENRPLYNNLKDEQKQDVENLENLLTNPGHGHSILAEIISSYPNYWQLFRLIPIESYEEIDKHLKYLQKISNRIEKLITEKIKNSKKTEE